MATDFGYKNFLFSPAPVYMDSLDNYFCTYNLLFDEQIIV